MTFAHPATLPLLALPLLLLLAAFLTSLRDRTRLSKLIGAGLESDLLPRGTTPLRILRLSLAATGLALAIIALAGPRLGHTMEQVRQKGRDIILAVDVSRSMLAPDLPPNRLTRAKLLAQDFISRTRTDRIGVIAFAGTAFLQAPLTIDYGAVSTTIQELDPGIIPRGGTNIAAAIKEAIEAFGKAEGPNRLLVIISDGEEIEADAVSAAKAAREEQIRIDTVGIGTPEGDLIPLPGAEGQFVRGPDGAIVRTRLDESLLKKVAEAGGGAYRRFQPGVDHAADILREAFAALGEQEGESLTQKRPIERYQWPLAAALLLLVASWLVPERFSGRPSRPFTAPLLAAALFLSQLSTTTFAAESPERLYADGRFEEAAKAWAGANNKGSAQFIAAFNRGCALYRAGKFEEAAEAFAEALRAGDAPTQKASHYNLGNSLFREAERAASPQGAAKPDLEKAIESLKNSIAQYDSALKIDPEFKEPARNREVAARRLKELEEQLRRQQEQQKEPQQQHKDQEKKEREKDQKQEQSGQDQKEKSGKGKDQESEQGQKSDGEKNQGQKRNGRDIKEDQAGEQAGEPSDPSPQGDSQERKKEEAQPQEHHGGGESADQQGKEGGESGSKDPGGNGERPGEESGKGSIPSGDKNGIESPASPTERGSETGGTGDPGNVPRIERDGPLEGEIRSAAGAGEQKQEERGDREGITAAEESEEAADGKMTRDQARRLIESLRSEEDRVLLRDRIRPERAYKDW